MLSGIERQSATTVSENRISGSERGGIRCKRCQFYFEMMFKPSWD